MWCQGGVGLSVPAATEPVSVDASGADRDRGGAPEACERGRGAETVGIVPRGGEQPRPDDLADALDGHEAGLGGCGTGEHPLLEAGDLLGEVAVPAGEGPQRVPGVRLVSVADLIGSRVGQCHNKFRLR